MKEEFWGQMYNEDKTMGIILKYQKSKFLMRLSIIFCPQRVGKRSLATYNGDQVDLIMHMWKTVGKILTGEGYNLHNRKLSEWYFFKEPCVYSESLFKKIKYQI